MKSVHPRSPPAARVPLLANQDWLFLAGMLVGIAIFYRGSYQLPISALGLALFGVLALLRPDLALLTVPLTVPLFFMPKGIWDERFGIRAEGVRFPLHEVLLLITTGSVVLHWLWHTIRHQAFRLSRISPGLPIALRLAPLLLFLLAGTLGVVVALPEGRGAALREWRWLIIEPIIFYGLVRWFLRSQEREGRDRQSGNVLLLTAFVAGGGAVGLVGMLQFVGLNLAPLIGDKVGFSDDRMLVEGVQRVSSVYGHPNNLGLYMGRVWPVAAGLALAAFRPLSGARSVPLAIVAGACGLLALGGLFASFSKGAMLGALAAVVVAGWCLMRGRSASVGHQRNAVTVRPLLLLVSATLVCVVVVAGLARVERLNLLGETSMIRLKTWGSALTMAGDHPVFGVGLDQFGAYYQEYIDPSLRGTNEEYTSHPHNVVLDVWLRMGVVGVVAFAWLVVRFYRDGCGSRPVPLNPLRVGMVAAMTAALVHGLVDNCYFVPDLAFAFWLLVGGGG